MTKKETLLKNIEASKARSAWGKGVKTYAYELVDEAEDTQLEKLINNRPLLSYSQFRNELKKILLSGADNWKAYSWNGCSLIYNYQIAERLCNNTELKITDHGMKEPNKNEQWLDTQARALFQAFELVHDNAITL